MAFALVSLSWISETDDHAKTFTFLVLFLVWHTDCSYFSIKKPRAILRHFTDFSIQGNFYANLRYDHWFLKLYIFLPV